MNTIIAFLKDAKTQTVIRAMLAPSGVVGLRLVQWGVPGTNLGPLTELIIQVLPFAATLAWSLAQKTHKALIAEVATILADRQQGAIIINKNVASDGAAKAVADPALKNVVAAGSTAAIEAATTRPAN